MTAETGVETPSAKYTPPVHELRFGGVVRGEMIKVRTARAVRILVILAAAITAGLSMPVAILTEVVPARSATEVTSAFVTTTLLGLQLGIFLVAAAGAVAGAVDFRNGTMRVLCAAVPRRTPIFAAKLIAVVGASVAVVGVALLLTAVVTGASLARGASWGAFVGPTSLLSLAGAGVAVAAVSATATSLGCLLRSSAGAVSAILSLLIIVTIALMAVPAHVLPPAAMDYSFGGAITTLLSVADDRGAWFGAVVAAAVWTALLVGWAAVSMRRRDV